MYSSFRMKKKSYSFLFLNFLTVLGNNSYKISHPMAKPWNVVIDSSSDAYKNHYGICRWFSFRRRFYRYYVLMWPSPGCIIRLSIIFMNRGERDTAIFFSLYNGNDMKMIPNRILPSEMIFFFLLSRALNVSVNRTLAIPYVADVFAKGPSRKLSRWISAAKQGHLILNGKLVKRQMKALTLCHSF